MNDVLYLFDNPGVSSTLPAYAVDAGNGKASMVVTTLSADLSLYLLLGASTAVSGYGFYVQDSGAQVGSSFSFTIPDPGSDPVGLPSIPSGAVGAIVVLSGNIIWSLGNGQTTPTADFKVNYNNYPKMICDPEYNTFGRVV